MSSIKLKTRENRNFKKARMLILSLINTVFFPNSKFYPKVYPLGRTPSASATTEGHSELTLTTIISSIKTMKTSTICPCCSNPMLHHISRHQDYWFCSSCRQPMPNFGALGNNPCIRPKQMNNISLNLGQLTS